MQRVDGARPFLVTDDRVWTYAETATEVLRHTSDEAVILRPRLDADSVFRCLAAIGSGGAVVLGPGDEAPLGVDIDRSALVVFTSGSSGRPKGVRLTMRNLEAASEASMSHLGHGPDDRWLLAMSIHHVAGLSILIRSAFAGGSVRLTDGFDPARAAEFLRGGVTMVSFVATMLHQLLDHDPGPYPGLRAVLIGGGPIPSGLLERGREAGLPVVPSYGMTETLGQVATQLPGSPTSYSAHPLPGIDVRIRGDGRVELRGDQVSPGYLGEADRESEWFVTGDLGEIDSSGALRILGRADTVIVTGGENVDPGRVEAEIAEEGGSAVVVGVPDEEWGNLLVAVYAGELAVESIDAAMRRRLPRHLVPSRWVQVGEIPRTALGKPDRAAVASMAADRA